MINLQPCPFCGGQARYSRIPGHGFSVLCQSCGALAVLEQSTQRDDLGAAWNRRTVRHNFQAQGNIAPCPFCASRTSLGKADQKGSILKCDNCGMLVSFVNSNNMQDSVACWNRRARQG